MLRTLVSSTIFGLIAAFLLVSPAAAQVDIEGNRDNFGPLTSAEQATLFDAGVEAYDEGDHAAAYHIWLPLAQNGNMSAQRNVAHLLRRGMGVEQDLPRAVYFYRRASEHGLVSAMVNLASMLRAGQGVDGPDYREAAQWLYVASEAGDPRAQYVLGLMAARGQGMEPNRDLAIRLFSAAAEQGLREAHQRLTEAGIEPESIGDAPERSPAHVPNGLEPLPQFAPQTSRQQMVEPQLRTTQIAPITTLQTATTAPSQATTRPAPVPAPVPATERVQVTMPSGNTRMPSGSTMGRVESQPRSVVVATPAPAQARQAPVQATPPIQRAATPTVTAPVITQAATSPTATQREEPQSRPPSQNIPSVQSVTLQPTPPPSERQVQPLVRSASDLVVLPPAPSRRAIAEAATEEETDEAEANTRVNRLLGGTR